MYTGDVSGAHEILFAKCMYSPRMWGCSPLQAFLPALQAVFPMHMGMVPASTQAMRMMLGIPHACGDVSALVERIAPTHPYSLRMWGCFLRLQTKRSSGSVFPVHTGMIPPRSDNQDCIGCIPRVYGDDALYFISFLSLVKKSFVHDTFTLSGSFLNMKRSFSSLP